MTATAHPEPRPLNRTLTGVLLVLLAIAIAVATQVQNILPAQYLGDSQFIQQINTGTNYVIPDYSFARTAEIYRIVHLANDPTATAIVSVLLAAAVAAVALQPALRGRVDLWTTTFAVVFAGLTITYLAVYSKDTITLLVVGGILLVRDRRRAMIWIIVFLAVYASIFRFYWAVVAVLFVGNYLFLRRRTNWRRVVVSLALGVVLLGIAVAVLRHGTSLDQYRETANSASERYLTTTTLINPPIAPSGVLVGILNGLLVVVELTIPVQLLVLGPKYALAATALVLITIFLFVIVRRDETTTAHPDRLRCVALVLATISVQAVYVPDFGSALKHLSPILPLLMYLAAARAQDADADRAVARNGVNAVDAVNAVTAAR